MKRTTARQRAIPGLVVEANRLLAAVEACQEYDWRAIDEAASALAQHVRVDIQPEWDAYQLGARRYDRLGFRRVPVGRR